VASLWWTLFFGGLALILVRWVFTTMKAGRSFEAIDIAAPRLDSQGIDRSSVLFSTYGDPGLAINPGAMILVGKGKKLDGGRVGFVLEIIPGRGVVHEEILVPHGIASLHPNASIKAKMAGRPLVVVLREMAAVHRAARNAR